MEQELVDQVFAEKPQQDKKIKKKEEKKQYKDVRNSKNPKNNQQHEYISGKLDLESNGGLDDDFSVDSTTPAAETTHNKTNHYEKVGSLKNKDSARSTSATLFALDSSRVDAHLLKSEAIKLPIYLGAHKPIFSINNKPILTIGPHWPYTLCLWISISISGYLMAEYIAINIENKIWYYILYAIICLLLFFFTLTALLNPGIAIERENEVNSNAELGTCPLCEIVLDNTTFHCMDCRVCIRGYDHHCPWTSKCIGANNQIPFYGFVGLFFLYFIYSMILCLVYSF